MSARSGVFSRDTNTRYVLIFRRLSKVSVAFEGGNNVCPKTGLWVFGDACTGPAEQNETPRLLIEGLTPSGRD